METKIPRHHVKGEICATRPAYREGRIPKAVKVYTVNDESQYILIQNVPSVGAKEELLKLCSSFGPLADHHILDEYPSQDKYTEVYLIKYKNINSARFAKRKLDDRSFFGGALHVCYAPEYESVAETREKLHERRRAVARKIKQHYCDTQGEFHQTSEKRVFDTSELSESPCGSSSLEQTSHGNVSHSSLWQPGRFAEKSPQTTRANVSNDLSTFNQASSVSRQTTTAQETETPPSSCDSNAPDNSIPPVTFDIPLPPKPNVKSQPPKKKSYEFARVRSHHATLPHNLNASKNELVASTNQDKNSKQISSSSEPSSQQSEISSKSATGTKERSEIVIRDYKTSKPTLKFVPRQTVKRNADESGLSEKDLENASIKKTAFLLGDVQGPQDIPGRKEARPKLTPGVQKSYQNTISAIRSKISKVISDNVKPP